MRMTSWRKIWTVLLWVLPLACGTQTRSAAPAATAPAPAAAAVQGINAARHRDAPHVVLVSFDGFRHDYVDRIDAPHFQRVIREGVRAELVPSFPTKTFPNHYTLVTGMYPARHGLVGNEIWDPGMRASYGIRDTLAVRDARWYGGEPVWVTAERQGMVSASFFWPGSEAPIGGVRPTYAKRYQHDFPNEQRVDTVLAWLRLPAERRPHFITLYFSDVDDAGHQHGPDSPEVADAVRRVDSALGRLLNGIAALPAGQRVNVILVSDHGMSPVSSDKWFNLEDYVDLAGVRTVSSGPYVQLFFEGDTAKLNRTYTALKGKLPHSDVWRTEETPPHLRYRGNARLGDLLVLMRPPYQVRPRKPASVPSRVVQGGNHGYDPRVRDQHGIFFSMGPDVADGVRLGEVENIHVYPFITRILGLVPNPEIDGRPEALAPALAPATVPAR